MLSELQTAKLDRRFELLDYDGDGVISSADFDLAAQNVCRAFDFPEDSVEFERVQTTYNALWVAINQKASRDANGKIGREQFVASCADTVFEAGGYDKTEGRLAQVIFDLLDAGRQRRAGRRRVRHLVQRLRRLRGRRAEGVPPPGPRPRRHPEPRGRAWPRSRTSTCPTTRTRRATGCSAR